MSAQDARFAGATVITVDFTDSTPPRLTECAAARVSAAGNLVDGPVSYWITQPDPFKVRPASRPMVLLSCATPKKIVAEQLLRYVGAGGLVLYDRASWAVLADAIPQLQRKPVQFALEMTPAGRDDPTLLEAAAPPWNAPANCVGRAALLCAFLRRLVLRPGREFWDQADMRAALARRDFTAVLARLSAEGYSQNRIGELLGISQPEVSAILVRGRRVMKYDLMKRYVAMLGIPAGLAGLASCICGHQCEQAAPPPAPPAPAQLSGAQDEQAEQFGDEESPAGGPTLGELLQQARGAAHEPRFMSQHTIATRVQEPVSVIGRLLQDRPLQDTGEVYPLGLVAAVARVVNANIDDALAAAGFTAEQIHDGDADLLGDPAVVRARVAVSVAAAFIDGATLEDLAHRYGRDITAITDMLISVRAAPAELVASVPGAGAALMDPATQLVGELRTLCGGRGLAGGVDHDSIGPMLRDLARIPANAKPAGRRSRVAKVLHPAIRSLPLPTADAVRIALALDPDAKSLTSYRVRLLRISRVTGQPASDLQILEDGFRKMAEHLAAGLDKAAGPGPDRRA